MAIKRSKAPKPKAYSYIRFSSPEQLKGNSLDRQTARSNAYVKDHGLELDTTLHLQDLGVSGYRGKNAIEGALRGFLEAVETGRVLPGSTLLVENLDRLSRDLVTNALTQFLNIINAGITVVTLMDNRTYSKASIDKNPTELLTSILVMMRAHEQSVEKSDRVSRAWANKRVLAAQKKPQSARCPAWLKLPFAKERKDNPAVNHAYEIIPERAALVVRIFEMTAQGFGKRAIAEIFNRENIPTWGYGKRKSNGWHFSYIMKILDSQTVLGTYQPGKTHPDTGKRISDGDPVEDYYPAVVTPELWQRAHKRPVVARGPRTVRVSNLFSGIVRDGYTGEKMLLADKKSKRNPNCDQRYLYSDIKRVKPGSKAQYWRYDHFEKLVIDHLLQVDWRALSKQTPDADQEKLASQIAKLELQKSKLEVAIDKLLEEFADSPAALQKAVKARASKLADQLEDTDSRLAQLLETQEERAALQRSFNEGKEEFKRLIDEGDVASRMALQTEIRRRVKTITAYRHGNAPEFRGTHVEDLPANAWPYVIIEFKNGVRQKLMVSKVTSTAPPPERGKDGKFSKKKPVIRTDSAITSADPPSSSPSAPAPPASPPGP